jgi:hypothetical protein
VIIKSEEVNDVWIRNTVHDLSYLFDRLACSESVTKNVSSDARVTIQSYR